MPEVLYAMSAAPLTFAIPDEQASTSNYTVSSTSVANESSAEIGTLPACLDSCCSMVNEKPFHPIDNIIKCTSIKQNTSERKICTCPSSIFAKYTWVTYYMTKGTIACFFYKREKPGLITFSNNGEDAFSSG
jgi:hypothetical protein